jgi:hypothetical protein
MNKATIQSITRVGQTETVAVQVQFSDGSLKEFVYSLPLSSAEIGTAIKEEVNRLNTIDGQIKTLQTLVGRIIS